MLHSKQNDKRHLVPAVLAVLLSVLLPGCATQAQKSAEKSQHPVANEALLKAAENHAGLIELYKTRLQQDGESEQARLALGEVYLQTDDPESALFTIEPLFTNNRETGEIDAAAWLLKSRALLALGQSDAAITAVTQAEVNATSLSGSLSGQSHPLLSKIFNHTGLIHAERGQYKEAREAFNKARHTMLDDLTVKNNLAMLDILEQDYEAAIRRLMPLYTSGQADEQIKANLAIALARSARYQEFKALSGQGQSEQETLSLFIALSKATLTPSTPSIPSTSSSTSVTNTTGG